MQLPIKSIKVTSRFRDENTNVADLIYSFRELGQLQPILVSKEVDGTYTLVAGFRRLMAATALGWETIEAATKDEIPEDLAKAMEYEENVRRQDFTWQERCRAIAQVHAIRKARDPGWGYRETAALLGFRGHSNVHVAVTIAKHLDDPEVASQPSAREALGFLVRRKLIAASLELGKRTAEVEEAPPPPPDTSVAEVVTRPPQPTPQPKRKISFHLTDCLSILDQVDDISVIFTDPPYGVDIENFKQTNTGLGSRLELVRDEHSTDPFALLGDFLKKAYDKVLPEAWLFMWCDFEHWHKLRLLGESVGWRVQRWPLVWVKPNYNMNQMPQSNFTKCTECGILMAKGTAVLTQTAPPNYVTFPTSKPATVTNPFYKPPEVHIAFLAPLVGAASTVLDPFCGSGSIAEAADKLNIPYIGCDINPVHIANAKQRFGLL